MGTKQSTPASPVPTPFDDVTSLSDWRSVVAAQLIASLPASIPRELIERIVVEYLHPTFDELLECPAWIVARINGLPKSLTAPSGGEWTFEWDRKPYVGGSQPTGVVPGIRKWSFRDQLMSEVECNEFLKEVVTSLFDTSNRIKAKREGREFTPRHRLSAGAEPDARVEYVMNGVTQLFELSRGFDADVALRSVVRGLNLQSKKFRFELWLAAIPARDSMAPPAPAPTAPAPATHSSNSAAEAASGDTFSGVATAIALVPRPLRLCFRFEGTNAR